MKKTGLLGGTFDPVHNGHIVLAENAYEQFGLDEIWMLVSPDPPHKQKRGITAFAHRYNMVKLAAEENVFIVPSDYENLLPRPSYTAQTLRTLTDDFPDNKFYFIIGEDSLDAIETWYHPEVIMAMTELIVAVRHETEDTKTIEEQALYLSTKYDAKIHLLKSDYVDISSTEIRKRVAEGKDLTGLVPETVENYIWTEKLYMK